MEHLCPDSTTDASPHVLDELSINERPYGGARLGRVDRDGRLGRQGGGCRSDRANDRDREKKMYPSLTNRFHDFRFLDLTRALKNPRPRRP